jgi:hypothetical protein
VCSEHCAERCLCPYRRLFHGFELYAALPIVLTTVHFDGIPILSLHTRLSQREKSGNEVTIKFLAAVAKENNRGSINSAKKAGRKGKGKQVEVVAIEDDDSEARACYKAQADGDGDGG